MMKAQKDIYKLLSLVYFITVIGGIVYAQTTVSPVITYTNSSVVDQDDMCIWVHPTDESLSTIIASDKAANKLFVYNLAGGSVQTIEVPGMPGNIDIRYNFSLNGELVDIVGYNDRGSSTLRFYKVDKSTRLLSYIGSFSSGSNYGFCLYRSPSSGEYYAFSSNSSSDIRQYLLSDNNGSIEGTLIRTLDNGSGNTEGMVCDDETGILYAGNESAGIYKFNAEPIDDNRTLVAATGGTNGFSADVEGLTIYYMSDGNGHLIASSQGNNRFYVFDRKSPHGYIKYFTIDGVGATDGIDVCNLSLNSTFSQGIFLCHDGTGSPYVIKGVKFEDLGLSVDVNYWDPREFNPAPVELNFQGPIKYLLLQNYPNPFNPNTVISYQLPMTSKVQLKIFGILGNEIVTLVNELQQPGYYNINFDGSNLTSGAYIYSLQTNDKTITKKMLLVR